MSEIKDFPFTCPSCGSPFGYGPDAVLFSIAKGNFSFNENLPCCDVRVERVVFLNDEGRMEIKEMEILR